jgi:hypothetical protein
MPRARRERAVPSLLAQGALMLLVGLGAWVLAGAAATPLALTLASVAVLVVTIGIVLFYRRDGGS